MGAVADHVQTLDKVMLAQQEHSKHLRMKYLITQCNVHKTNEHLHTEDARIEAATKPVLETVHTIQ